MPNWSIDLDSADLLLDLVEYAPLPLPPRDSECSLALLLLVLLLLLLLLLRLLLLLVLDRALVPRCPRPRAPACSVPDDGLRERRSWAFRVVGRDTFCLPLREATVGLDSFRPYLRPLAVSVRSGLPVCRVPESVAEPTSGTSVDSTRSLISSKEDGEELVTGAKIVSPLKRTSHSPLVPNLRASILNST